MSFWALGGAVIFVLSPAPALPFLSVAATTPGGAASAAGFFRPCLDHMTTLLDERYAVE